jgi:hypothetical protein
MRKFQYFLILFIAVSFTKSVNSQNSLKCGLFTNFSLNNNSKIVTPSAVDINFLKSINKELGVSTYLNKMINEGSRKIIISLYTTGTYNDLVAKINSQKYPFVSKNNFNKGSDLFSLFNFNFSNNNITRIVFSEPDSTLCIVIDIISIDPVGNFKEFSTTVIDRITFSKVKK